MTFRLRGYHPLWRSFPESSAKSNLCNSSPDLHLRIISSHYPDCKTDAALQAAGLGSFPFARRYSGSRFFFPFLGVLRCFSSPGYPPRPMNSALDARGLPWPVFGLGNLRVNAWLAANRSLTQPSRVLHRSLTPRHPPYTLNSLTTFIINQAVA